MAKPRFLALLLVSALLALSFSQGFVEGRKVRAVRHEGRLLSEEMVATVMDYGDPEANTNRHGGLVPPKDPPTPPGH